MSPNDFPPRWSFPHAGYGNINNPQHPATTQPTFDGRITTAMPQPDTLRLASDVTSSREPKLLKQFTINISKSGVPSNQSSSSRQTEDSINVFFYKTEEGKKSKHYIEIHNKVGGLDKRVFIDIKSTGERPDIAYTKLIIMAINDSPGKELVLSDIYKWLEENIPYYRPPTPPQAVGNMAQKDSSSKPPSRAGWKNSIRHNLSLHKTLFRKRDATPPGISSSLWSAIEDKVADYMFIDKDRLTTVYKRKKQPNSTTSSLSKSQNGSENKNTGRPVKRKISSSSTITSPQTSTVTKALPEGDNLSYVLKKRYIMKNFKLSSNLQSHDNPSCPRPVTKPA